MNKERKTNLVIRAYQEKDKKQIQNICLITAPHFLICNEMMRRLLLIAFCNYYIEHEPHNCFVAANELDEAVGYILCAENANAWYRTFSDIYVSSEENEDAKNFLESTCKNCLSMSSDYPAHLHTDIIPEYQRLGLGSLLMEALFKNLQEKQIPGLMLSVSTQNIGAIRFYEKIGFSILDQHDNVTVMGIRICPI